jgi:predicted CopG family antitoxin
MSVSIKISEDNYKKLSVLSGTLREELKKPVSLNDAISYLYKKKKLSEFAGKWKMSDENLNKMKSDLREGWSNWGKRYA